MGFLTGKTVIITGGGRASLSDGSFGSIGYGIATAFAKEGANLVITGRNVAKLEKAKLLLTSTEHSVSDIAAEVGYNEVYHFIRQFKKSTGNGIPFPAVRMVFEQNLRIGKLSASFSQ